MLLNTQEAGAHLLPPIKPACLCGDAGVSATINDVPALDDLRARRSEIGTRPLARGETKAPGSLRPSLRFSSKRARDQRHPWLLVAKAKQAPQPYLPGETELT